MKTNVFAFKDNSLGCFTTPFFNDVPVENMGVGMTRAIIGAEKKSSYKHKVLYKIGEFDDLTGKFTTCDLELVVDCDEVLARISENGKQETVA